MSTDYLVDIGAHQLNAQRQRRRRLMRVGVPIAGVVLIAAAILGISFYSYQANRSGVLDISDEVLRELESRITLQVANYLDPAVRATDLVREIAANAAFGAQSQVAEHMAISALARTPQVDAFDFADSAGDFMMVRRGAAGIDTKLILNSPNARQVLWIRRNAAGEVIAREPDPTDDYDPRTRTWYTGALGTQGMYWTDPYIFFTAQIPGITASTRYEGPRGNPYVFGVDISLKAISDFLASLKIGRSGRAAIIDENGYLIAVPDIDRILKPKNGQLAATRIDEIDDAEFTAAYDRYRVEGYGRRVIRLGDQRIISIVAPLPTAERTWKMLIVVPEADFTGFVSRNSRATLIMSLGVIAVAAVLAGLLVRQGLRTDRAARLLLDRTHAIGRQSAALAALAQNTDLFDPTRRSPPHVLTETLLDATGARRVSLWRLTEGAQTLNCEDSFDSESGGHVGGMELSCDEVPRFLAALTTGEELEVADASGDPRTAEIYRVMMQPLGSRSLFVAPVRQEGQVKGALWVEDLPESAGLRDFLRIIANMMGIRMASVSDAAREPHRREVAAVSPTDLGERSFSAELALKGIDLTEVVADVYPKVAVMVVQFSDPLAIASRPQESGPILADAIAETLQRIAAEHQIPYLKMNGQEIVAAAGWQPADATAVERMADAALAARQSCLDLFNEAERAPSFGIGIDCGVAMGSVLGREPRLFNLWGEAVTTATAMARSAMPGGIQATEPIHRSLARDFLFRPRGHFFLPRVGSLQTFILASRM